MSIHEFKDCPKCQRFKIPPGKQECINCRWARATGPLQANQPGDGLQADVKVKLSDLERKVLARSLRWDAAGDAADRCRKLGEAIGDGLGDGLIAEAPKAPETSEPSPEPTPTCGEHPGEYGTNCRACDEDRRRYREWRERKSQ